VSPSEQSNAAQEIKEGSRFAFGANWAEYLSSLNQERVEQAKQSVQRLLGQESLQGKRFLDVGCGSGLFSLAAAQLGAKVTSFDFDPESVGCALQVRGKFGLPESTWQILQGSVLDREFLGSLGQFDVVYSWGVLHHTGQMYEALENVLLPLAPGGTLAIAIYNNPGAAPRSWRFVKRLYNRASPALRWGLLLPSFVVVHGPALVRDSLKLDPLRSWREYGKGRGRGMSAWTDLVDWVGGYPYEVAKPEEIFEFYRSRGLELLQLRTCGGGLGCNEYAFKLPANASGSPRP
jgi:2-polyprenyl-3-methyl-5-hydroxy-6-metoxy-1,4-benzoquinol methylase